MVKEQYCSIVAQIHGTLAQHGCAWLVIVIAQAPTPKHVPIWFLDQILRCHRCEGLIAKGPVGS